MAQYGLGKNTPIKLTLGKDNYEALLERHGQWVRWRQAAKCSCVTKGNQPDIRCKTCRGTGYIYSFQESGTETLTLQVMRDKVIKLPENYENRIIERIYTTQGEDISFSRYGQFLKLSDNAIENDYVTCVAQNNFVSVIEKSTLLELGGGYYTCKECSTVSSGYTFPCDIISVDSCTVNDKELTVKEIRQNMLLLELKDDEGNVVPIEGDVVANNIQWVHPFRFFVLNQSFSKIDSKLIEVTGGDAMLTFPYYCGVAENDIITVLSGSIRKKAVLQKHSDSKEDVINDFFVSAIESIFTPTKKFEKGVDYILAGTNRIVWLKDTCPKKDDKFSIVYDIYPTYTVAKDLPTLRTSEDQRIPRKSVLRLLATFDEKRRANRND